MTLFVRKMGKFMKKKGYGARKRRDHTKNKEYVRRCLSDTTRRGTLSKNRKYCLKPCKKQSQRTTTRSLQNSLILPRPCAEASCERPKAPRRGPLAEASPRKASDGMPILQFARGRAQQTYSWPPSRPNSSDEMSRPD